MEEGRIADCLLQVGDVLTFHGAIVTGKTSAGEHGQTLSTLLIEPDRERRLKGTHGITPSPPEPGEYVVVQATDEHVSRDDRRGENPFKTVRSRQYVTCLRIRDDGTCDQSCDGVWFEHKVCEFDDGRAAMVRITGRMEVDVQTKVTVTIGKRIS